jgi:hypothetical protein
MNYPKLNSFEKTDVRGQKFLKHLQNVSTKLHGKHWLYTVLCCRFNATQRDSGMVSVFYGLLTTKIN